jgi:glycosyltransferase involved in cell wall biosynthesis
LRKTTGLVFAKTDAANRFITRKGFSRVVTLPVGLDNESLELGTSVNWREELGIPSDSKIILYVGKLEPRRNTRLMLSLVERMKSESAFFVFAGEGVDFVSAKEIAAQSNLTNVRFLGNVPQRKMKSLYEEAYCLMLASDYEIYGMVILEAMYFGVPVVTSRTAGAEQIISHNVDGVIVDGIDVALWHETLTKFLQEQDRRAQMAKHAQDKIASEYTWDQIAKRYESHVDVLSAGIRNS